MKLWFVRGGDFDSKATPADLVITRGAASGFEATDVGNTAPTRLTYEATNPGSNILQLTGTPRVRLEGAHPGDFTIVGDLPSQIASWAGNGNALSGSFSVEFSPTASGLRSAEIVITSNDPDQPVRRVALSGTATGPDTQAPVLTLTNVTTPTDAAVATASVVLSAGVSDNSGETITPTFSLTSGGAALTSPATFSLGNTQVFVRAQDSAGNAVEDSYTVTVTDNEAPKVTASNVAANTGASLATASIPLAATVVDNSGETIAPIFSLSLNGPAIPSPATFAVGTTTVFMRATDSAGNTGQGQFSVVVSDGEKPVIAAIPNITLTTDAGLSTASSSFTTSVSDNVDVPTSFTPVFKIGTNTITSPHNFPVGVTTVSASANADTAGNTPDPVTFTVTVTDGEKPVIAAITDITTTTDAGVSTASTSFAATVSDNVDSAASFTPVFKIGTNTITSPHNFPVGVTTVSASANADTAGNTPDPVTFTVTVTDGEKPVIAAITDITTTTDAGVSTASTSFAATVSDNVDSAASFTPVFKIGTTTITSPHDFPVGVTTVNVSANNDAAGNAPDPTTFTVNVTDPEAPIFAGIPTNITQSTDAGLSTAVVTFTAPTANDNVDGAITPVLVSSPTAGLTSGSTFPLGVTTLTYTATDAASNVQTASFTVTISDGELPVFVGVPTNITQSTDAGLATAVVTFTAPTANDNVDGAITPILVSSPTTGLTSGSAFPVGVTTLTYTATDAASNAQMASFTVTIGDGEKPVFAGMPANITQSTDAGLSTAVVTFTAPTASDNVDGAIPPILVSNPTAGLTSGSAFPVGVTTLTYTATDVASNTQTASFTVTVGDGEKPVIAAIANITATTDAGVSTASTSFATTVSDNVDTAASFTPVFKIGANTITSPHAFPVGITTVSVTANNDIAGNTPDPVTFTVTVGDDEAPAFTTFPSDIALSVDFPATTAVANWITPTATDNVSGLVTIVQTAGPASGAAFPTGTTTVTYTATDIAGNVAAQSFTVTVTAIPPGTVTFVVHSDADGTYFIQSTEPALNASITTSSGSGRSPVISVRPGTFPVTFTVPSGTGVESAQCDAPSSTLNAISLSGAIVITSGLAVTCTIKTLDSAKETVAQIGSFMETRSQLILQNQPSRGRRIDRLEGRTRNNGGISGFGLALKNDRIPFAAHISTEEVSFSYSLRQSRAEGTTPKLTGDITSILGAFGITPRAAKRSPFFSEKVEDTAAAKSNSEQIVSKSSSSPTQVVQGLPDTNNEQDSNITDNPTHHPFDVWAEGKIGKFETGNGKGSFGVIHIGADYLIRPHVLLGASVQGDWTNIDGQNAGSRAEGFGFMLSPYLTAKLSEGFYFDARLGWGKAYNNISPFGTYTDSFESERWIASAALIGTWNLSNGLNITPEARLSYFKETSESYTDSLNVLIPSVEIETGTFELGPTFSRDFTTDKGSIYSPFLTVAGIWTFSQKNSATNFTNQANLSSEGVRARLEAGASIQSHNGSSLNLSANYDGIGDNTFSSWGASLRFDYQF